MTRASLRRKLFAVYAALVFVLVAALAAKGLAILPAGWLQAVHLPRGISHVAAGIYDFLKDMSVVIVTIAAVYLANLLQRRSNFVERLEEEWVRIVSAKADLLAWCQSDAPTREAYLQVTMELSRAIDTMRIAYRNVGETDVLVGLYPFAPLHNMRRAMDTVDPRDPAVTAEDRARVADVIRDAFAALRENFLEELDLDEPTTPVLRAGSRRLKRPGATGRALQLAEQQQARLGALPPLPDDRARLQAELDLRREEEDGRAARAGPSGPSGR